jgi:hypothetical protein
MQSNGKKFHNYAARAEENAEEVISVTQRTSLHDCKPEKSCQLDIGVETSPEPNMPFSIKVRSCNL